MDTGVRADYMRSQYPTQTFPNHYTIMTVSGIHVYHVHKFGGENLAAFVNFVGLQNLIDSKLFPIQCNTFTKFSSS